jgi:hypothetical protein
MYWPTRGTKTEARTRKEGEIFERKCKKRKETDKIEVKGLNKCK